MVVVNIYIFVCFPKLNVTSLCSLIIKVSYSTFHFLSYVAMLLRYLLFCLFWLKFHCLSFVIGPPVDIHVVKHQVGCLNCHPSICDEH